MGVGEADRLRLFSFRFLLVRLSHIAGRTYNNNNDNDKKKNPENFSPHVLLDCEEVNYENLLTVHEKCA